MKLSHLVAVMGLAAVGTAMAHGPSPKLLFRFDSGVGVQPFRSSAGAPVLNTVAGVAPGGAPWLISSFDAFIFKNGDVRAHGEGVLLGGADGLGSRAGPRQVVLSLFCRQAPAAGAATGALNLVPFNSEPAELDPDGNFDVRGALTDATGATPPLDCGNNVDNRPVLLIRTVAGGAPGAWFAAGLLADDRKADKGGRD